ncbi:hypothetical protein PAAG_11678 [Paracoccidioides lutzii Pb01]|uniref:Uncharacterized protein n=1 Tax=Paracoccidioides lutzii (strain ATCC MYA-826 / Pb01) TaxID=502779 RepID=A0A0A2VL04_PARBA|nr:hypothetical protein PAAG_11678 [Paracoccidioides lutzii Pb01]KGQ01554.1 hypothetical protein PAAG_11678 [Paracoccidioides lutzii Pb01]
MIAGSWAAFLVVDEAHLQVGIPVLFSGEIVHVAAFGAIITWGWGDLQELDKEILNVSTLTEMVVDSGGDGDWGW